MTPTTGQICMRCVMDSSAPDITFNAAGECNYCTEFLERYRLIVTATTQQREQELHSFVEQVKKDGAGKRYDCIVGVSGGVDSSWALVQAVELGLRPLAVHMDNGWNSELAQNNIANLVRGLGVDLYTHVINWKEYRALMQAFFDADVVDVELLYDNAMQTVNYERAAHYNLKYILSGSNQATEGMRIPPGWNWYKYDATNIRGLAAQFGKVRINSFPIIGTIDLIYYTYFKKVKWIPFLDYFEYVKSDAVSILEAKYGYKPYPFKHYESIFTRFYQGYLLPQKFGIDKRQLHLATLVAAGQLDREEALLGLRGIAYSSPHALDTDINYFLKKMGWSREDLGSYLGRPAIAHDAYPSERALWRCIATSYNSLRQSARRLRTR